MDQYCPVNVNFREIFRFEFAYHLRRVSTWPFFAVLVVVTFLFIRGNYTHLARSGDYFLNAPFVIAAVTVIGSLLWLLVAAAVAGDAAARDVQTRMHPLTYTAPVSKADFLGDDSSLPSSSMRGNCPAAILLEPAVLYIPSTAMYNAAMYTRVSSLAPRDA
jgi:hypothetical protein